MPKIELDPSKRAVNKLLRLIKNEMRDQGVTQADMAKELYLAGQSVVSKKFKTGSFSIVEIVKMLSVLGITLKDIEESL